MLLMAHTRETPTEVYSPQRSGTSLRGRTPVAEGAGLGDRAGVTGMSPPPIGMSHSEVRVPQSMNRSANGAVVIVVRRVPSGRIFTRR